MKFTLSWLKKHLDTQADLQTITDTLTHIGLEVEGVEDKGAALAPFTVAYVVEAKQHPNADRLRVCQLDTKFGKVQVVCGAPNARTGMKAIFAPDGSTIPANGTVLKSGEIRGEKSNGMMVSEREMGLSDEHNGIIEVPDHFAIGTPLPEVLGLNDPVIEIKLTPNRADCAGVRGIARDLAAAGLGTLKPLSIEPVKGQGPSALSVVVEDSVGCPLFMGRSFKGVKNGPSPAWLQDALKAIGLRPISALVDITNYFTFDLGRPLHVFDVRKVKGNQLIVRSAKDGEQLEALNDKTYTLKSGMVVIADTDGVEALGGVMGGKHTGCELDTTEVFLEVALFDPVRTAQTGRELQIITDARYRFERGVDPMAMADYLELASRMILDLCGGDASDVVSVGSVPSDCQRTYTLEADRFKTIIGLEMPWAEQVSYLEKLGFTVQAQQVTSPSWRPDILGSNDLIEEIIRLKGYQHIPTLSLPRVGETAQSMLGHRDQKLAQARRAMAARGLMETITFSFIHQDQAVAFAGGDKALQVVNPISLEMGTLRPSILPTMLEAAVRNASRGYGDGAFFEIGPVFKPEAKTTDLQQTAITALRFGEAVKRQPQGGVRKVDWADAKADALAMLEAMGVPTAGLQIAADAPSYYHPGRSGSLRLGPAVLGYFGELHPVVIEQFGGKALSVCGAEIIVEALPPIKPKKGTALPLLKLESLQPLSRDFAFVLPIEVPSDKLVKAIRAADKDMVVSVDVFDDYRGKGLAEGQKSLALSVTLQPKDKAMTDAEIEAISQKIVQSVEKATGASLRA